MTKSSDEQSSDELSSDGTTNIPMVLQHEDGKPCKKPWATPAPAKWNLRVWLLKRVDGLWKYGIRAYMGIEITLKYKSRPHQGDRYHPTDPRAWPRLYGPTASANCNEIVRRRIKIWRMSIKLPGYVWGFEKNCKIPRHCRHYKRKTLRVFPN